MRKQLLQNVCLKVPLILQIRVNHRFALRQDTWIVSHPGIPHGQPSLVPLSQSLMHIASPQLAQERHFIADQMLGQQL